MAIDVGAAAIDRGTTASIWDNTFIDYNNSCNATGTVETVKCWANTNLTSLVVGSLFLVSGTTFQCRDSEGVGNVTAGSEQTFTGLTIAFNLGDYIGGKSGGTAGRMELASSGGGGDGVYYVAGEYIDPSDSASYTFVSTRLLSLNGAGTEAGGYSWTVEALREAEVLYCEALTDTTIDTRRDITTENEASRTQIVADMKVAFPSSTKYYKHHHHHNGRALCVLEEV